MRRFASLSLATLLAATPAFAAHGDIPPVTTARNDAAAVAFATAQFLDTMANACVVEAPTVEGRFVASGEAWARRNEEVAAASIDWLSYAVETAGGGDTVRTEALADEVRDVVEGLQEALLDRAFPETGVNEGTCLALVRAVENGEYDLLGDAKTAPLLREIVAIDWSKE